MRLISNENSLLPLEVFASLVGNLKGERFCVEEAEN